jgi:hypothetical protein
MNAGFVPVNELQAMVMEILTARGFEFMRAPYGSLGQVRHCVPFAVILVLTDDLMNVVARLYGQVSSRIFSCSLRQQ